MVYAKTVMNHVHEVAQMQKRVQIHVVHTVKLVVALDLVIVLHAGEMHIEHMLN